jgi:hypothetical protein
LGKEERDVGTLRGKALSLEQEGSRLVILSAFGINMGQTVKAVNVRRPLLQRHFENFLGTTQVSCPRRGQG